MTQQPTVAPVRRSVTVNAPLERAFAVFTEQQTAWWPKAHRIGAGELEEAVLEPREGGRWYERGAGGTECDWGRVLAWEPPHRLVVTWQIGGDWRYDPDPAHASEVEVRFTALDAGTTRVDLEHTHIERLEAAEAAHRAVSDPNGWGMTLEQFAEVAAA
jgi:uncharacterized protein YndB with AHSA1/START domain